MLYPVTEGIALADFTVMSLWRSSADSVAGNYVAFLEVTDSDILMGADMEANPACRSR